MGQNVSTTPIQVPSRRQEEDNNKILAWNKLVQSSLTAGVNPELLCRMSNRIMQSENADVFMNDLTSDTTGGMIEAVENTFDIIKPFMLEFSEQMKFRISDIVVFELPKDVMPVLFYIAVAVVALARPFQRVVPKLGYALPLQISPEMQMVVLRCLIPYKNDRMITIASDQSYKDGLRTPILTSYILPYMFVMHCRGTRLREIVSPDFLWPNTFFTHYYTYNNNDNANNNNNNNANNNNNNNNN